MRDKALIHYLSNHRWAMHPPVLNSLCRVVERHIVGQKLSQEQIRLIAGDRNAPAKKLEVTRDGRAIIEITGISEKYSAQVNDVSQPAGTSLENLTEQLTQALHDPKVKDIFLRIESPGGSLPGLPDFADLVFLASQVKPVIAFADDQADSAAYWIGSQANVFYANQSAGVGSIGVYMVVPDYSQMAADEGITINIISSGPNKGAGYPGAPVTDGQKAVWQESIDHDFGMFLSAVVKGRDNDLVTLENLIAIADGREYPAARALEYGLIDKIMTLQEALDSETPAIRQAQELHAYAAAAADNHNEHDNERTIAMSEKKTDTTTAIPDAAAVKSEAVRQERVRITEIQQALAGDDLAQVRQKAIDEGMDLQQAKALAFDTVQAARRTDKKTADETIKAKDASMAEMQKKLDTIANSGHADTLISQPDTTKPGAPLAPAGSGDAKAFDDGIKAMIAKGMTQTEALRQMANDPAQKENHAAWIAAAQPKQNSK